MLIYANFNMYFSALTFAKAEYFENYRRILPMSICVFNKDMLIAHKFQT